MLLIQLLQSKKLLLLLLLLIMVMNDDPSPVLKKGCSEAAGDNHVNTWETVCTTIDNIEETTTSYVDGGD